MGMSRSEQMARIRGQDTAPEKRLRSMLWARGLRYRLHAKTPAGRPDIVFVGARTAIFIDGCFWHGCPIHYVRPRSRDEFWAQKLAANVERDRRQTLLLERGGWTVLRIWEHQVVEELEKVCSEIEDALRGRLATDSLCWRVWRVNRLESGDDEERRHLVDLRDATRRRAEEGPRYSRSGPKDPMAIRRLDTSHE